MLRKIARAIRILRYAFRMHAALLEIKARDQLLTLNEQVSTHDDYEEVIKIARDTLDEVEDAKVPWWRVDPAFEGLTEAEIAAFYD